MSQTHFSGPVISTSGITPSSLGAGVFLAVPMAKVPGTHAAGSGTILEGWRAVLPSTRPMTLRECSMLFSRGASAPQGGTFRLKAWSGAVSKGLIATSVAGGTFPAIAVGGLAATFPGRAVVGLAVHTVGTTGAGGGGRPTLYFSYAS